MQFLPAHSCPISPQNGAEFVGIAKLSLRIHHPFFDAIESEMTGKLFFTSLNPYDSKKS